VEWNRFDICEAWYLALCEWHAGMGSPEYRRMCKLTRAGMFRPAPNLSPETLSENGQEIYRELTKRFASGWRPHF
jgi:hypothetical protein